MDSIQATREILGWCTVLCMGVLFIAFLYVTVFAGFVKQMHGKMFGICDEDLTRAYFQYLAQYKIAIFVLNFAPYVALRIVE